MITVKRNFANELLLTRSSFESFAVRRMRRVPNTYFVRNKFAFFISFEFVLFTLSTIGRRGQRENNNGFKQITRVFGTFRKSTTL